MTEIKLEVKNPHALVAMLREMLPINADAINPDERPTIEGICAQIEAQVPPAIEEPIEFASVVKVRTDTLFVRIGAFEQYPWVSGACARAWDDLDAVEVLRVGVGDNEAAPLRCIGGMLDHPEHAKRCPACSAKTDEAAYNNGVSDTVSALVARLQDRRLGLMEQERRVAYDEAIKIAKAL